MNQNYTFWTMKSHKNSRMQLKQTKWCSSLFRPTTTEETSPKKAIQVSKDHFISVLCGTDVTFPMQLWCHILRQAEHQLNLLHKSRVDPSISAFEALHGKHDYNANPLYPLVKLSKCT